MYKTEITTRQDIEKAIEPLADAIVKHKKSNEPSEENECSSGSAGISLISDDAEFILETLEICANKFPEAK